MALQLPLPDIYARWPWPRRINPFYEECAVESAAWLRSFSAFPPAKQAALDKCDFGLLAALIYPDADKGFFRSTCDLMNMLFAFDEQSDKLDGVGTRHLVDILIDVVHNPDRPRPNGEPLLGEITRQFWSPVVKNSTASGRARFIDDFTRYVESVVIQSQDREEGRLRTVDEFLELRRLTAGVDPCYAFALLNVDLPRDVYEVPILKELRDCVTDMVAFCNDLVSCRKEYAHESPNHNILTVVMHEKHLSLAEAVDWLAIEHEKRVERFLALWPEARKLSFGSEATNKALAIYLDHLANWPRGNECYSYESGRYFGSDGARAKLCRVVEIVPLHEDSSNYAANTPL
ncbi:terpenoid synthase [Trametes polyzona]|nr:terpenoid synthase [Trametes polyzona]